LSRKLFNWHFSRNWPVKHTCICNCTQFQCIHSWGNWVCFLSFGSIAIVALKLWNMRRTWLNLIFNPDYLANLLWIVWYGCMKMYEWWIGVEYDVYHNVLYFSPLLELWEFYEVVELLWWCCWWLYMFMCIYVGEFSYMQWCWIVGVSM